MRAALYLRVSTNEQTVDNQRLELMKILDARGWTLTQEYSDEGVSGAKSRDKRPGFDALCKAATRNQFDVCVVWAIDRISRSLIDLIHFMNDLNAAKVQLYIHQQALDTTTPSGRLMFQVSGAYAEFENSLRRERVKIGIARAKSEGKQWGNKAALTPKVVTQIVEQRAMGASAPEIAKTHNISVRSVWRALNRAAESSYLD